MLSKLLTSTVAFIGLITESESATRVWQAGQQNECRFAEFLVDFFGESFTAYGIGDCASFYLPDGQGGLSPAAIILECPTDGSSGVIVKDYNNANCDASGLNYEEQIDIGDTVPIYSSGLSLPSTLRDYNCNGPDDCSIVSLQQYWLTPCDPFGDLGSTPAFVGSLSVINGYCSVDAFNTLSLRYDCEDETIRFYNNLNCDESDGVAFENTFADAAICRAQGPSAQQGGFNESSIYTCAQIADSSDSDSGSGSSSSESSSSSSSSSSSGSGSGSGSGSSSSD